MPRPKLSPPKMPFFNNKCLSLRLKKQKESPENVMSGAVRHPVMQPFPLYCPM